MDHNNAIDWHRIIYMYNTANLFVSLRQINCLIQHAKNSPNFQKTYGTKINWYTIASW